MLVGCDNIYTLLLLQCSGGISSIPACRVWATSSSTCGSLSSDHPVCFMSPRPQSYCNASGTYWKSTVNQEIKYTELTVWRKVLNQKSLSFPYRDTLTSNKVLLKFLVTKYLTKSVAKILWMGLQQTCLN